jgi:putative ATP-dependent endonuclease of OLD family
MRLDKLVLKNFRCFGEEPTEVSFADGLTVMVGANGTGKTAVLLALARMFGRSGRGRGLIASDFHTKLVTPSTDLATGPTEKKLWVDAWFSFPELELAGAPASPAVAEHISELVTDPNGKQRLRVRLSGTLTLDGHIEEELLAIPTMEAVPGKEDQRPIRGSARSVIHVEYIPATRDPAKELAFTSRAVLGRLLQAVKLDATTQKSIEDASKKVSETMGEMASLKAIQDKLHEGWGRLHRGNYHNKARIDVTPHSFAELLGQATVRFAPNEQDGDSGVEHLSDGQRSLFYLSLIRAALTLEQTLGVNPSGAEALGFDADRVQSPVFTLIAVEEPENHLAPHYLGRILDLLEDMTKDKAAQIVLTTHAPGVARRCDPLWLRHLRLDKDRRVRVGVLTTETASETYKLVKNTLWASPEMLFARVVLLVEGDSERLVLPRIFRARAASLHTGSAPAPTAIGAGADIPPVVDESFISVVPLAGRYTDRMWLLLRSLDIPFVTLIDLDSGRDTGGISRIQSQLEYIAGGWGDDGVKQWAADVVASWGATAPTTSEVAAALENLEEKAAMFFSAPIDLDMMLLCAFPDAYPAPTGRAEYKNWAGAIAEVLSSLTPPTDPKVTCTSPPPTTASEHEQNAHLALHGHVQGVFDETTWAGPFKAYEYHMERKRKGKSKPLSHHAALSTLTDKDLWDKTPDVLKRLVERVTTLANDLPE